MSATGTVRNALRSARLRRLLGHHLAMGSAKSAVPIALAQAIFDDTGSSGWASAVVAAGLMPYLLLSGFAGVLADRIDRVRLLRWTAVCQASSALVLAACISVGAAPVVVVLLAAASATAGTSGYPTVVALLPGSVGPRDLAPANVLVNTVEAGGWVAGPTIAGAALVVVSPSAVLIGGALSCALGALVLHRLPTPRREGAIGADATSAPSGTTASHAPENETVWQSFRTGIRTVAGSIEVTVPLLLVTAMNVVYGGASIGLLFVSDSLDGDSSYGVLKGALGAGGCVGLLIANRLTSMRRPIVGLTLWTLAGGAPFALLAVVDDVATAVVLVGLGGFACMVTEIVALTIMLRSLSDQVVARAFGLTDSLLVGSNLAGTLLVPVLVHGVGLRTSLFVVGAAFPAMAALTGMRWLVVDTRRGMERRLSAGRTLPTTGG